MTNSGVHAVALPAADFRYAAAPAKHAQLPALRSLWSFLAFIGQLRARRDMSDLATQLAATRPELAASLREAARRDWV